MPYKWDPDYIYLIGRRGDEDVGPLKPKQLGIFNGMIYCYIDPQHPGWGQPGYFSDYFHGEALILKLRRSWLPLLQESVKEYHSAIIDPNTGIPAITKDTKRCRGFLDYQELAPTFEQQIPDFLTKVYQHKCPLPVIDGTNLSQTIIKDTKFVDFDVVIREIGQIFQGNFTIGPGVGDDYATWALFVAAFGTPFTGNMTGTQTGNVVEVATANITETLAGFTLLFTSNTPHNGDPTAGWQTSKNFSGAGFFLQHEGPGITNFNHLRIVQTAVQVPGFAQFLTTAINVAWTGNFSDLMLDGGTQNGWGISWNEVTPTTNIWDCVIWHFQGIDAGAVRATTVNANDVYENIDAYDNSIGLGAGNQAFTANNMACFDNTIDFFAIGGATGTNCLSTDATANNPNWAVGVGNLINQITAACVQGANPALANFMDILEPGTLVNTGVANAIAARIACIRNRAVPNAGGGTSIGAAEILEPVPPPTPTPTVSVAVPITIGATNPSTRQYWNRMDSHMMGI